MNAASRRPLIDHWLWEKRMLRVFVVVAAVIPIAACAILAPFVGAKALFALIFLCLPLVFGIVYRLVGKRVDRLRESASPDEGLAIPALLVRGAVQSPGVVTVGPHVLTLRPVVGDHLEIRFDEVTAVREVRFFNGSLLPGKTGFWLTVRGHNRLGCAVPVSFAETLRASLMGHLGSVASDHPA